MRNVYRRIRYTLPFSSVLRCTEHAWKSGHADYVGLYLVILQYGIQLIWSYALRLNEVDR